MADFWIRPGIVTSNGNNRALTVEIEYAPSVSDFFRRCDYSFNVKYFADDCWPLIKEFGDEIMHRHIDNKPPSVSYYSNSKSLILANVHSDHGEQTVSSFIHCPTICGDIFTREQLATSQPATNATATAAAALSNANAKLV